MARRLLALPLLLASAGLLHAQPTYKLDVKPTLKPQVTLTLEGARVVRSALKDDPGFRLQYHFKKDGKTVHTVEARSALAVDVPAKEPGTYTVVLELFYPAYKGGTQQKGEFKPVGNVLTFRVEPPGTPGDPIKLLPTSATPDKK